ncbi:MAG TPA: hypothetical protein VIK75_03060, partial [Calditerricola sp.]
VGNLLEQALRKHYGDRYDELVKREDGRTFLVPLDFNEKDKHFRSLYRDQLEDRLPVVQRHGNYYAFVNGAWVRVPERWAQAPNALFLGTVDGGRRRWKTASSGR